MNELALFAGAGGGILGGNLCGFKTVCTVEWEPYAQAVLLARQADGLLERFPIWDDVKTFNGAEWRGKVDVITAGFPCQPFSSAGKREGSNDLRNGWPDTIRIIREVGCPYALLENVPGLLNWDGGKYFGQILGELSESGFDAGWKVISAAEIGAPHRRDRLWIMAYPKGQRSLRGPEEIQYQDGGSVTKQGGEPFGTSNVADSNASGERRNKREGQVEKDAEFSHPAGTRRATRASKGQSGGCGEVADIRSNTEGSPCGTRSRGDADNEPNHGNEIRDDAGNGGKGISHTNTARCTRLRNGTERGKETHTESGLSGWWAVEPALGRVAHGVAHRVDRLKAIGNGQVAGVAATAWRILSEGLIV